MGNGNWRSKVVNRDVCLVIGISGCGKTTFLYYLKGVHLCESKPSAARRLVDVCEGNHPLPNLRINHSPISQNFSPAPVVVEGSDLVFLECPPFLNNWSHAIPYDFRIIQYILRAAKSVKIVLLIDYDSFLALHMDSVRDVLSKIVTWFNDGEIGFNNAVQQGAISCVLTKVPGHTSEENLMSVEELCADLSRAIPGGALLWSRLMVYDPLNRENRRFQTVLKKEEILHRIQQGQGIQSASHVLTNIHFGEVTDNRENFWQSLLSFFIRNLYLWGIFFLLILFMLTVIVISIVFGRHVNPSNYSVENTAQIPTAEGTIVGLNTSVTI